MKIAKIISGLGVVLMSGVIIYGFVIGDFAKDGSALFGNPWGIVSIVDLYTGFTLFSIWIAYREGSFVRAAPWIIGMMLFGFLTGSIYLLVALVTSGGDWQTVWNGKIRHG